MSSLLEDECNSLCLMVVSVIGIVVFTFAASVKGGNAPSTITTIAPAAVAVAAAAIAASTVYIYRT